MKCLAITLASLCLYLHALSQQETLPIVQTYYVRGSNGGDLVPGSQSVFQYDKNGRQRVSTSYHWIEEEKRWVPDYSVESKYDDIGNLVLQKTTRWVADTIFVVETVTQKFDTQNRLFEYSYFVDRWSLDDEEHYALFSYDQHGCNYEVRQKYIVSGVINFEAVRTYVTDEQCRTLVMRSYQNSTTEGAHHATVHSYEDDKEEARHEYYVDSDTTLLAEYLYDYDQSGRLVFNQITGNSRTYLKYDEAGNLTSVRTEVWNGETMSWERYAELYQSFNSDNNVLVMESYSFPTLMGDWHYSYIVSYAYNNDGKLSRVHSKSVVNFGTELESVKNFFYRCDGLESETTEAIMQGDQLGLVNRTITTYNHPPGCDNVEILLMIIAPNPTSNFIRLLFADVPDAVTIHIISSNGQLVNVITTDSGINPLELDVSALGAGVYIVQAISEGFVATSRFVKN